MMTLYDEMYVNIYEYVIMRTSDIESHGFTHAKIKKKRMATVKNAGRHYSNLHLSLSIHQTYCN